MKCDCCKHDVPEILLTKAGKYLLCSRCLKYYDPEQMLLPDPPRKFTVLLKEVHYQHVDILARNEKEALQLVEHGEGDYGSLEYSHTIKAEIKQ